MHGTHEDHDALLSRLIDHYRDVGWWIERPEIAGVDLCLRRDAKVMLLACADANASATRAAVEALHRQRVDEGAHGAILVSPAGFDAGAIEAAQGVEGLRLLDRQALHGLLGDGIAPVPALPRSRPRKTTGLDLLFRMGAVLCAIGFVLVVLAILSRTAGTAGEPPSDPSTPTR